LNWSYNHCSALTCGQNKLFSFAEKKKRNCKKTLLDKMELTKTILNYYFTVKNKIKSGWLLKTTHHTNNDAKTLKIAFCEILVLV